MAASATVESTAGRTLARVSVLVLPGVLVTVTALVTVAGGPSVVAGGDTIGGGELDEAGAFVLVEETAEVPGEACVDGLVEADAPAEAGGDVFAVDVLSGLEEAALEGPGTGAALDGSSSTSMVYTR